MSLAHPTARRLTWQRDGRLYEARPARGVLVRAHASALAGFYNAPVNAAMMGGSGTMTEDDVIDFWAEVEQAGGVGVLTFVDGALVGDMDLRGAARTAEGAVAEFAIMIGDEARKGQGLGRSFAAMLHVHAFRDLGIARLYVPPRRENTRVHALNDWLGYARDDSAEGAAYADEPGCLVSSIPARAFADRHPGAWREVAAELESRP